MPQYFFDIEHSTGVASDNTGLLVSDAGAARDEAIVILCRLIATAGPDDVVHDFAVWVRDPDGLYVIEARSMLAVAWKETLSS
jgi:hypothetical protein